jgi:hypothetical protein
VSRQTPRVKQPRRRISGRTRITRRVSRGTKRRESRRRREIPKRRVSGRRRTTRQRRRK